VGDRPWDPDINTSVANGATRPSLRNDVDLSEIVRPDCNGERRVACTNPCLAREWASKRETPFAATEADLDKVAASVRFGTPA